MLAGAVLGWLIVSSAWRLLDTANHEGPGVVHYEDWSEEKPESQYKRHNYAMAGMMLGLGLLFWFMFAKATKIETAKAKANEEYLEAQIQAHASAYHRAFVRSSLTMSPANAPRLRRSCLRSFATPKRIKKLSGTFTMLLPKQPRASNRVEK